MKSKKAEEYLKNDLCIFCCNKKEWETDKLEMLPSGDFIDNRTHIHGKSTHIPFVNYYKCIEAVEIAEQDLLDKVKKAYCDKCDYYSGIKCVPEECVNLKGFIEAINKQP